MNVESLIVDEWLGVHADLAGLFVSTQVPGARPSRFVTVERTGGPEGRITGTPILAVQVWAENRPAAGDLAMQVAQVLRDAATLPWVGRVNVSSVYHFPDPDSRQSRYQIVVELVTKFD
ncbi:hypothetical protein [Glutamicibacter sp. X7]